MGRRKKSNVMIRAVLRGAALFLSVLLGEGALADKLKVWLISKQSWLKNGKFG
jgi:hypothetical protein